MGAKRLRKSEVGIGNVLKIMSRARCGTWIFYFCLYFRSVFYVMDFFIWIKIFAFKCRQRSGKVVGELNRKSPNWFTNSSVVTQLKKLVDGLVLSVSRPTRPQINLLEVVPFASLFMLQRGNRGSSILNLFLYFPASYHFWLCMLSVIAKSVPLLLFFTKQNSCPATC